MPKTVKVSISSDDKSDNSATGVTIETDRGAGFLRTDGRDMVTNKDKEAEFVLQPAQRLIIEAYPQGGFEMDHFQNAARAPGKPGVSNEDMLRQENDRLSRENAQLKGEKPGPSAMQHSQPAQSQTGTPVKPGTNPTQVSGLKSSNDVKPGTLPVDKK